jgi:hypothetical protein
VLERAADIWEVAQGKRAARYTSTRHVDIEPLFGARHDVKWAGGGSQPEERHASLGSAAAEKNDTEGFGKNIPYPTSFEHGASILALDEPLM